MLLLQLYILSTHVVIDDNDMSFQLHAHVTNLCQLCVGWKKKVLEIPAQNMLPKAWSPSEQELNVATAVLLLERRDLIDDDEDRESDRGVDEWAS